MSSIVIGVLAVAALVAWAPAHAAARSGGPNENTELRDYPIHFDGPMVNHGPLAFGPDFLPHLGVRFHGGPVQTSTVSYSIYWQPAGTYMSPPYKTLINRFLTDVGGSPIYGMATTYSGSNGPVLNQSIFAGTTIDTTPYPSGGPHDRDLQAAVSRAISANDWPTGLNAQYFIFTSKHAVPVSGYCAYHSAYNFDHDKTKPVVYAFTPYVGFFNGCDPPYYITPNNDIDSDGSIISISHEQMEMVTDPLINAWYGNGINEIGDICIFSFGEPYGPGQANMMINRHPYFLQ